MMTDNPDVMEPDEMDANVCARDHNVQFVWFVSEPVSP